MVLFQKIQFNQLSNMARMGFYSAGIARNNPDTIHRLNETEVYEDYNTMTIRTKSQDREIQELNNKLQEKVEKRKQDVKSLIAYYFLR